MTPVKRIECVPNFSEGRDPAVIARLREAIQSTSGVRLLDYSSDRDHNRSVFTFVGEPDAVENALIAAARVAVDTIDLTRHQGAHPRIGALDVAPFVPLDGATMDDCRQLARRFGDRLWQDLGVPVYFYEEAAEREAYRRLQDVRRGGFEALRADYSERPPDIGGPAPHPTAGATAVGARKLLVAYNINLATEDLAVAQRIARRLRESSGGLPAVKALGLALPEQRLTQVSLNLTDFERTPPHVAYERVVQLAQEAGVEVAGAELIGLLPRGAAEAAGLRALGLEGLERDRILENRLERSAFVEARAAVERCSCGADIPAEAQFCPGCGRPLTAEAREAESRLEATRRPPTPRPEPDEEEEEAPPEPEERKPAEPQPITFGNPHALKAAYWSGAFAALISSLPILNLLFFVWFPAAGFFAVASYRRRSGLTPDVRGGAKLGWLTAITSFALTLFLLAVQSMLAGVQGFSEGLAELQRQFEESGQTEVAQQVGLLLEDPTAMGIVFIFMLLFTFSLISMCTIAGGALGARVLRKD